MRYLNTTLKFSLIFLLAFLCSYSTFAQSKAQLEQTRKTLTYKIEVLSRSLTALTVNKNQQISRYNTIETQIESRKKLIETIKKELELIDEELELKSTNVDTLDLEFEKLLGDYAQLLHIEYKDRLQRKKNILSTGGILSALTKWRYIKQFELYLAGKLNRINKVNDLLATQKSEIVEMKLEKESLLKAEKENLVQMEAELELLDKNLKLDIQKQGDIKTQISEFSSERERLNAEIGNYVYQSQTTNRYTAPSNENSIGYKKGFLLWPVNKQSIKLRYGDQYHPQHKNILINNTGLDIIAQDKAVSSVSHGVVSNVYKLNNRDYTLIIQHDDWYYTVYSNLSASYVQKNDIVSSNQLIGELKEEDGKFLIHFEIWKQKENLNPTNWLKNN